jgi:hypothetical protein
MQYLPAENGYSEKTKIPHPKHFVSSTLQVKDFLEKGIMVTAIIN